MLSAVQAQRPTTVQLRRPTIGFRQPLIEIVGHSEQGKTGIALTAAALHPDMSTLPGCPRNFDKLFEVLNPNAPPDKPVLRRIQPIEAVNIVDGEKDTERLLTVLQTFPDKMVDRVFIMDTYGSNSPYDLESATNAFELFAEDPVIQATPSNCNIYDTVSGYVGDLNDQQKIVSKKHAAEEQKRKKKTGQPGDASAPAILADDELARINQTDWEWRNEKVSKFLRHVKGFSCMSICLSKMKKLYFSAQWDGKSYQVDSPPNLFYADDIRVGLGRSGSSVTVEVLKNRYGPVVAKQTASFKLGIWTLAEILIWLYGL